jgi:hypothetical protein
MVFLFFFGFTNVFDGFLSSSSVSFGLVWF